jgi:chromosome segregation ATPase
VVDRNGNTVLAYAPASKGKTRNDGDPIEQSGQAIVGLLNEAAETARATCEEAVRRAQKLSHEFRAAEDKIRELELELRHYQDRAARAEKWLAHVHQEIEQKFFGPAPPDTQLPRGI